MSFVKCSHILMVRIDFDVQRRTAEGFTFIHDSAKQSSSYSGVS